MKELNVKTERLVRMLEMENLQGVLFNSQHNFAWLTRGGNSGIDLSRENGASSLLVRCDGKRFVIANCIEMPRILAEEISEIDFEPVAFDWNADKENPGYIVEKSRHLLSGGTLGSDSFFSRDVRVIEGSIAECRYQLTSDELDRFRRLGDDAGRILGAIHRKIEAGKTEIEIANIVHYELGKAGINLVVNLVAADERISAYRHPVPTANVWNKTLMIVVCAKRHGLIASLSRIFSLGKITDELKKKTDAVAAVHARMMHATRPGTTAGEIFKAAVQTYAENGYPNEEARHHQGGACGYKTRDWVAHSLSIEQVHNDQAFAWNPSITGTKSEETFIVSENGSEVITRSPNFPMISNVVDGIEYLTPGILVL